VKFLPDDIVSGPVDSSDNMVNDAHDSQPSAANARLPSNMRPPGQSWLNNQKTSIAASRSSDPVPSTCVVVGVRANTGCCSAFVGEGIALTLYAPQRLLMKGL
jgi:hypothetical protein